MKLSSSVMAELHAAHAPGSTAADKANAAASVRGELSLDAAARATSNLRAASLTLEAAASLSSDPVAQTALTGVAAFMVSVSASISGGMDPAQALTATPTPPAPHGTPGVTTDALTYLLGSMSMHGSVAAEASLPLLDGLIRLSANADNDGLEWGAHVAIPFANGVTFAGGLTQDRTGARRAELAFGYAATLQAHQEGAT